MAAKRTIGQRLLTGVGALVALSLLGGATALWLARTTGAEIDTLAGTTTPTLERALRIRQSSSDLRSEQRRLLLAAFGGDRAGVVQLTSRIQDAAAAQHERLDGLEPLLTAADAQGLAADIRERMRAWADANAEVVRLAAEGHAPEALRVAQERCNPAIDALDDSADHLVELQHTAIEASRASAGRLSRLVQLGTLATVAVSVVFGGLVVWSVRGITGSLTRRANELREGAEHVTAAALQVSTSAQALSQGATEQAASLEETSASMEEMASMTRQNAENSLQAAQLMADVDHVVRQSESALQSMVASMDAIQESSNRVGKIIKTIDEIAFQTNILALNAAVEAARAGEAGMGFAVVAEEVRNLAQRSAQAARDTADLIEESIVRSTDGTRNVGQVSQSIEAITGSVSRVKGLIEEVSIASRQQAQGIDQVSQSLAQMEKVTQTTAATAEESAAASEELNAQAAVSMAVVQKLQVMVGCSAAHAGAAPAPRPAAARARRGQVVALEGRTRPLSPEEQIPLGTGTFGPF